LPLWARPRSRLKARAFQRAALGPVRALSAGGRPGRGRGGDRAPGGGRQAHVRPAIDVIRGELLYSSNPLAQAEHELYVLRRAADLAPLLRARTHAILHEGVR